MRIFGDPERTKSLLKTVGMKEGEAIESGMLTRQIERAQRKVESHNFDARKNLLEYDDVANDQRKVIYRQRTEIMSTDDIARRHQGRARRGRRQHRRRVHPARQRRGAMGRRRPRGGHGARLRRAIRGSRPGSRKTRRATARTPPRATSRRSRPPTTRSCARSGRR